MLSVGEYMAWKQPGMLVGLLVHFGLYETSPVQDWLPAARKAAANPAPLLRWLDRLMREPPRPGRGGLDDA